MLLNDSTNWSYFPCLSGNSVVLDDLFFCSQSIFCGISESMNEVALVLSFKGVLFKKSSVQCLKKHLWFRQCLLGSMPSVVFSCFDFNSKLFLH